MEGWEIFVGSLDRHLAPRSGILISSRGKLCNKNIFLEGSIDRYARVPPTFRSGSASRLLLAEVKKR